MKKTIRVLFVVLVPLCLLLLGGLLYWYYSLPDQYYVEQGDTLIVNDAIASGARADGGRHTVKQANGVAGDTYTTTLRWRGIIPIKEVSVTVVDEQTVVVGGTPFGVKLYTDGVLVVSLSSVDTPSGNVSPARNAGLKVGDLILSIDGKAVYTNEEVSELVKHSQGKPMALRIKRDGIESELHFCAVFSQNEKCYKAGIWVRDSSAGIGTLTFYDPKTNVLAGLGHAVCDVDTGDIVPIASGELVPARIYGITKSKAGAPGELRGAFDFGTYGPLLKNGVAGVYARSDGMVGQTAEVVLKQDIRIGEAQMCTTISGKQPQWYDIRITQVRYHDENATRNMVIEITDQRLLDATGGIVQGMSGSPIIQDGKLVGAVTHVLVNDPTKGYGIFAENMLETAQNVAKQKLKEAS